jgi:EmrB/QacA subfamily drug resistance transporter
MAEKPLIPPADYEPDPAARWAVLLGISLTSFLLPFLLAAVNIAMPDIQREFRADAVLLSWVATIYILSAAVLLLPLGRLAEIHGRKKLFLLGIGIFTVSCLGAVFAWSMEVLLVLRVCQGLGGAMTVTTSVAILMSVFPPLERGKALGFNVAAVYLGLTLGPVIGGALTSYFSWRGVFGAAVLLGLAALFLAWARLKGEWAEARGESFDLAGAVIYGVALVCLLYGATTLPDLLGAGLVVMGLAGVVVFVLWELRTTHPVFEVRLFRNNKPFAFSNLAALINYSATFAGMFLLSLYLQYVQGLTPHMAGLVLLSQPLVMTILSPYAGRLSDRREPGYIASVGMGMTSLGLVALALLGDDTPLVLVVGILLFMGVGYALFSSPNTNAVMSSVDKRYYGVASGAVATMRVLGMTFSMAVATVVFALVIGRVEIVPEVYPQFLTGMKTCFTIFAVLCAVGVYFSFVRGRAAAGSDGQAPAGK